MCFRWCRNSDYKFKLLKDEHGLTQHISLVDIFIGHPRVRYPGLENRQQGRVSRSFLPARIRTISEHHYVVGVCLQHMASRSLINDFGLPFPRHQRITGSSITQQMRKK
jgi:hypothetical protein